MTDSITKFNSPFGTHILFRYPDTYKQKGQLGALRAWDAADELMVNWVDEHFQSGPINIVNDTFGALAIPLAQYQPTVYTDSFLTTAAIIRNASENRVPPPATLPSTAPMKEASLHLIKIPKSLNLFKQQLIELSNVVKKNDQIVFSAMIKHLPKSAFQLIEQYIGPTSTSLAKKKARLIFATPSCFDNTSELVKSSYDVPGFAEPIMNLANVFSFGSLDIGTRFFLPHMPIIKSDQQVLDLGCGNGILGIAAGLQQAQHVTFRDESYMALASAQLNWKTQGLHNMAATFSPGNCGSDLTSESFDIVLNNPPFHQGQVVGDHLAIQMFKDAYRVLKPAGELWVVGNRHLGYASSLKRLFKKVDRIADNQKFTILCATK